MIQINISKWNFNKDCNIELMLSSIKIHKDKWSEEKNFFMKSQCTDINFEEDTYDKLL